MEYIAYLHKDKNSDFGVSFPDFPGCVTAGKTLDEARVMAVEALALHIAGMAEDGAAIPEPSTIDDLADEMIAFLQALVCIPTINPPGENYVGCATLIGEKLNDPRVTSSRLT